MKCEMSPSRVALGLIIAGGLAAIGCSGGGSDPAGPGGAAAAAGGGKSTAAVTSGSSAAITSSITGAGAGGSLAAGAGGAQSSSGGVGGTGAGGDAASSSGSSGSSSSGGGALTVPERLIVTGVRGLANPAATSVLKLHNGGASPVSVTALALAGPSAAVFQIMGSPDLPATIAPGADQSLTIRLLTNSASLPAAPAQNDGAAAVSATLNITLGAGSAKTAVYGLALTVPTHEPTLGQILTTLGYKVNAGKALNNANPNTSMTTSTLPGVEAGTDEIPAQLFQKAGMGTVTLEAVARFSPRAPCPFGWYPMGAPGTHNAVGTMEDAADAQTSDKARMVSPPVSGPPTFDPGAQPFGVWVYTDQLTGKYDTGGNKANGDYDYSEDKANSPANVHRFKAYPLKDAAGTSIADSYLLAVEEAANGDYQDYVFVLRNVKPAP